MMTLVAKKRRRLEVLVTSFPEVLETSFHKVPVKRKKRTMKKKRRMMMMEIYLNMISGDLLMLMIIKKRTVMERMIRAPSLDLGPGLAVKRNHVEARVQVHQDLEVGVEIKRKGVKVENLDPPALHHPPVGPGPDQEAKSDPLADLDPLLLVKRSGHAPAQVAIKRRAGAPGHPPAPAAADPVDPDQGIGQERSANEAINDVARLKQTIMHHTVARYIRHLLAKTAIELLIDLNIE